LVLADVFSPTFVTSGHRQAGEGVDKFADQDKPKSGRPTKLILSTFGMV